MGLGCLDASWSRVYSCKCASLEDTNVIYMTVQCHMNATYI